MAPIKFEDNIREKFEEREIQPASDAWKKLSSRMESDTNPIRSRFIWYSVAAVFIGVLIIASVFFNRTAIPSENTIDLVEVSPTNNEVEENRLVIESKNLEKQEALKISSEANESNVEKYEKVKTIVTPKQNKGNLGTRNLTRESAVAALNSIPVQKEANRSLKEILKPTDLEESISEEIEKVVAQIEQMQKDKSEISNEEVNALLIAAQRNIQKDRVLNSQGIDANALLGDVESELDKSFREKVYAALGDGVEFIRTAVVDRNN